MARIKKHSHRSTSMRLAIVSNGGRKITPIIAGCENNIQTNEIRCYDGPAISVSCASTSVCHWFCNRAQADLSVWILSFRTLMDSGNRSSGGYCPVLSIDPEEYTHKKNIDGTMKKLTQEMIPYSPKLDKVLKFGMPKYLPRYGVSSGVLQNNFLLPYRPEM